jgi:septal ring factor EnvC (AmiA/AmiB activator)
MTFEHFIASLLSASVVSMVGLLVYIWTTTRADQKEALKKIEEQNEEIREDHKEAINKLDTKLEKDREEHKEMRDRLVTEEKTNLRQDGEMKLLDQRDDNLAEALTRLADAIKDVVRTDRDRLERRAISNPSGGYPRTPPRPNLSDPPPKR